MSSRANPNAPAAVVASWLAALCGGVVSLAVIAAGQGLGAILGGCRWIGVSLPLHRQTWALVNQPSLAFSAESGATGYWLGGVLACLLVAALCIPLVPRPHSLTAELLAVQCSWMASVVGLGWMALLDPWDGHISRFLRLHNVSPTVAWVIPVIGAWAALIPTLRLLALARGAQPQMSRWGRIVTVVLHFVAPTVVWVTIGVGFVSRFASRVQGSLLEGLPSFEVLWPPVLAAALPSVSALLLAWLAYPRPSVRRLAPVGLKGGWILVFALAALVGLQLSLGGPLSNGNCRGILWSHADGRNNIRPWINPTSIFGAAILPGVGDGE